MTSIHSHFWRISHSGEPHEIGQKTTNAILRQAPASLWMTIWRVAMVTDHPIPSSLLSPHVPAWNRLLHSLSVVAIGLSVGYEQCHITMWHWYETWPPTGWHQPFIIGWSKYRLVLPYAAMHYRLMQLVGITTVFQGPLTVSLHSLNSRHLPAVKAVQGDCERVSAWSHAFNGFIPPHNGFTGGHCYHMSSNGGSINSLDPGRCGCNPKCVIFKHIFVIDIFNIFSEITIGWMSHDCLNNDKTTLVQVMAWWQKENLIQHIQP